MPNKTPDSPALIHSPRIPPAAAPGCGWPPQIPRSIWSAATVYGAAATIHLTVLMLMKLASGGVTGILGLLTSWDAKWFIAIAEHGYAGPRDGTGLSGANSTKLAFMPMYPMLIRAVHEVTGLGYAAAAVGVAHLSLVAALAAVHGLVARIHGPHTATIMIVLLAGAQPMALVLFMGYSEPLFLALAASALLALHRRAWIAAGFLGLPAGLTRPTGVAVTVAMAVAAVNYTVRQRRLTWRPATAVLLSGLGTLLYVGFVGMRAGQPDAWFQIQQRGWGTHWDWGRAFVHFLGYAMAGADGWVPVSTAVLIVALLVVSCAAVSSGSWPPLNAYGAAVIVLALGQSNYYHSKLRMLLCALIFLLPLARTLAATRPRTATTVLVCVCLFGSWYGSFMLTLWQYAI